MGENHFNKSVMLPASKCRECLFFRCLKVINMYTKPHEMTDLLDALEDGIYVINNDYIVEFMNKAMVKVFGNGTGKKCHQVINRSDEICSWCRADDVFCFRMVAEVLVIT